jgi:hypothetical protein
VSTPQTNPYERLARLEKAQALIEVVDRAVRSAGLDPHKDGYQIADLLRRWTPALWASAAVQAGKKTPSKETIDIVIASFKRRAS